MKQYDRVRYHAAKARKRGRDAEREAERRRFALTHPPSNIALFSRDVRLNMMRMLNYVMGGRCKLSLNEKLTLLQEYLPSDAPFLAVNNPEARIRFHRIWTHHIRQWGIGKSSHFVTLAPLKFAVPTYEAEGFSVLGLQQWTRQVMRGFDFVGNAEVAYYSNAGVHGGAMASFHVHLIVFKADKAKLGNRMKRLNARYSALIPGRKAAHEEATKGSPVGRATYMAKESVSDYRVFEKRQKSEWVKKKQTSTDIFGERPKSQNKQPGPPKTQLKIRRITRGRHFDKLIFGGGACKDLIELIRRDLKVGLPHSKRKHREHKYSGCFEGRRTMRQNCSPWVRIASGFYPPGYDEMLERARNFGEPDSKEWIVEQKRLDRLRTELGDFDG